MPDDFTVTISGLGQVERALDQAPADAVARGFLRGLEAAAAVIEDALAAKTPIRLRDQGGDIVVEGGDLQSSITHVTTLDSGLRGGTLAVGFGKLGYIANILEYGHRITGHEPGLKFSGKYVFPNPFMRKAFDFSAEEAMEAFQSAMADALSGSW